MATNKPDNQEKPKGSTNIHKPEGPDSFGMPDLAFTPIKREAQAPAKKEKEPQTKATPSPKKLEPAKNQAIEVEKPKKSILGLLIFTSLIVVLFALVGVYVFVIKGATLDNWVSVLQGKNEPAESEVLIPAIEEDTSAIVNEENMMVKPPEASSEGSAIAIANPTQPRFYIIVGGFAIPENARRYREQLVSEGYASAKVIEPAGNQPLTKVSVEDHPSLEEALKRREEVKQKFDLTIWVLKY